MQMSSSPHPSNAVNFAATHLRNKEFLGKTAEEFWTTNATYNMLWEEKYSFLVHFVYI
jgi:hypothetical protein